MKKTKILLFMSDPLMRTVLGETIDRAGYVVISVGDLGSALDWLTKSSPDLLITRAYVSGMPGHEAARYLNARYPLMRVLILGGFLEDDRLQYRQELEGFDVFPKPYTGAEPIEKVKEVLDR